MFAGTLPPNETDPTTEQIRAASKELVEVTIPAFRKVAPESEGGGAYLNEANVDELN